MANKKESKIVDTTEQVLLVKEGESMSSKESALELLVKQKETTIKELEASINALNFQIKDLMIRKDELIQKDFDNEKLKESVAKEHKTALEAVKKESEMKAKTLEQLSNKYNELAKLFDEYIKGADDMVELSKLFLRNNLRTQELLQNKIKAFNGEGDK